MSDDDSIPAVLSRGNYPPELQEMAGSAFAVPYTPAHAAQDAALRLGIVLPHPVAEAVVAAVLECADDEYRAEAYIASEIYDSKQWPDAMATIERRLKQKVAYAIAEAGLLPTALPRKVVTRPAAPWEPVKVELVVPVRRP